MNHHDNTFFMILSDDATKLQAAQEKAQKTVDYDPEERRVFNLKMAFRMEAEAGRDVLIETEYTDCMDLPDFTFSLATIYERFAFGQEEDYRFRDLTQHLRCTGARIAGIYDLKKPFDAAKSGAEILPPFAEKALRDLKYEQARQGMSFWDKTRMLSPRRREAFRQSLSIYNPD